MKNKIYCIIVLLILIFNSISFADNISEYSQTENNIEKEDVFESIEAANLLLGEANKNRILYERNSDEKIYPASITKLMTAILVVENTELDEIVTVSDNAVHSVPSGYVNANLQVGEELTVEDLLYVMLIPSANDAANALAEYVGGSIESFATMMNTRAKELGCTGSNFTNPSGLHQNEHYTTTKDLYKIAIEAYSKSIIKKIIGTTTYTLPQTNKYDKTSRIFTTTNYLKRKSMSKYYYEYCVGAKTGYTGEAGNCVVEYASKDGIELISIVMGEKSKIKGQKFIDSKKMFEYTFENYENKKIATKNKEYETIKIPNATKDTRDLDVIYKDNIYILEKKDVKIVYNENEKINNNTKMANKSVEYTKNKAPIAKGSVVGKITYEYDGIKYTSELIANDNVEESKNFNKVLKMIMIILIIYIIYNLKKSKKKQKKYGNHGKRI